MLPQHIGRYEVERKLGRGGMAVVYLAFDAYVKRRVAIKVMARQLITDPQFLNRFRREAEVIATLESPSVVQIYDFGEYDEQPYIVMSYMPGGSLRERFATGLLDLPELSQITQRIAQALDEAHSRKIIHCDLKPSNILFNAKGEAFLSDFGIARVAGISATQTSSGIMGTPAYMSPEQASGVKDLDGRSDIYSLGVILFQALTGQLPYEADTPVALALKHLIEPIPSLSQIRPHLPPGCELVIRQALAKDREQRFTTAGELAATFAAAIQGQMVWLKPELEDKITSKVDKPAELKLSVEDSAVPASSLLPLTPVKPGNRRRWSLLLTGILLPLVIAGLITTRLLERPSQATATSPLPTLTERIVVQVITATPKPTFPSRPQPTASRIISPTMSPTVTLSPTTPVIPPTHTPSPTPTMALLPLGKIAFVSDRDGDYEIYTINTDGSDLIKWTDNSPASDGDPACAPDGQSIVYHTDQNGSLELYILDLNSRIATRIRNDAFPGFEPDWSPDSQFFVFQSGHNLFRMSRDGSEVVGLLTHPADDTDASWSANGQKIAFSSNREGNYELYLMNADGSGVTRLTNHPARDLEPAWSPDGQTLAFYSDRDGDNEIYTLHLEDGKVIQLTNNTVADYVPDWSPDGQWLVFETHRDGNAEIYIMRADGTEVKRVTNYPAYDWGPCWLSQ